MSDSPKPKRSPFSFVVAIFLVGVTLIGLVVMRVNAFFRRNYASVDSLKYPVLIIQPNGMSPFAEWASTQLEKFPEHSPRTPVNGTTVIDSDFNLFTQENVERKQEGELKMIARYIAPGLMRVKYTFDLRRVRDGGRDVAMKLLLNCPAFVDNEIENASIRQAVATQMTMAGVLDALKLYQPVAPPTTSLVTSDAATTEPGAAEPDANESGEPLPGFQEPERKRHE